MNTHMPPSLSLVIPLYNETDRFPEGFSVCQKLHATFPDWEFIFVNDGSEDGTLTVVREAITGFERMKLLSYKKNRGKGYAIKKGVLQAEKPFVLFSDIDFSTPIKELEKLYACVSSGASLAIGTRKLNGAKIVKHQHFLREWMGKQFTSLTNLWLGLLISDYTCGFKLFKTEVARQIFKKQRIERWGFDAEILFLAHHYQAKIKEVPICWQNDERTRVAIVKDSFRSLKDLYLIRWYYLTGKYNTRKKNLFA